MFGYVTIHREGLTEAEFTRFRAYYCGLCHVLGERFGWRGQASLTYDMTFMALLLSALYEPSEQAMEERCWAHPLKKHACITNDIMAYVADMNIALSYYMCQDRWQDDHNAIRLAEAQLLKRGVQRVQARWPERCAHLVQCLNELNALERAHSEDVDATAACMGRMVGDLMAWPSEDYWAPTLREVGEGLGKFIYVMDAYEDLAADQKKGRYNPLYAMATEPGYEGFMKEALSMLMAESTWAFEKLPIVKDANILRNILYSGVWGRYSYLQKKGNKSHE